MNLPIEKNFQKWGYKFICGIDEVNIMSLAFEVCAMAVVMDPKQPKICGIDDSKKVSKKKREELTPEIIKRAIAIGIGQSTIKEANTDIKMASFRARHMAVKKVLDMCKPDIILVDFYKDDYGNIRIPVIGVKRGDELSYNIACASILAKYTFDKMVAYFDKKYPEYDWIHNTGCPTKKHIEAIKKYGLTRLHRKKWVKNTLMNRRIKNENF